MQPDKPKVTDLNPHLLCVLCGGYFIDATTVIECLHSFCRSCIVKYLERNKYCPICDVLIHKSKPLTNIRPDHTLQNIVYKLVPRLFQREMVMRKDFYRINNMQYPLQDPMSMGIIPDDYHIFTPNDSVSICLHYENENSKKSIPGVHKRYLWCPASLPVVNLKKFVHIKFELASVDHFIELSHKNYLLDDHLTIMDVVYMFDWKRKDPLTISYRILKIEIESVVSDVMDIKDDKSLKSDDSVDKTKVNVTNSVPNDTSNTNINIKETPVKLEENNTIIDNKASDSKEVQLEISENGIIKVTNISQTRDAIQPNVTIEQTADAVKKEKIPKIDDDEDKKKLLKVYPGSKIKKNKPKLDTIVEKIKKQSSTKYKTLTSPTKHWNPSISKTSVLAKKKEVNGVDKKNQKFFKSREEDNKKEEDKTEESLKRLAEVPLMKINPQTLCPIMPSSPPKKTKKMTPKKNTLAQSLALLPVRPTNHNPFTSPLNPFMYGAFTNSGNSDTHDSNDFLKAMSELCPPSSTYHNSLPPSVSVLFNPLYAHHRQSQAKKTTTTATTSPADVQKLSANKQEEKNGDKDDPKSSGDKAKDECTNNNNGEDKMEVEKEIEKT
ncbi:polycomb group protein Psc-like [Adelges cooleyi]|uniref:polycomb group protein Psc-like n=1 Tax=Adelges cooleyi TaxID=133065 RepID=UPI00218091CA|nr:polycomb group protein Psc-like [Adelges cooleyi]XP_050435830.1 polycomb group protein Psc-like [Adelges cooleyi]